MAEHQPVPSAPPGYRIAHGEAVGIGVALDTQYSALACHLEHADDAQLRTITFWSLGSLGGSNWSTVLLLLPPVAALGLAARRLAPRLDALMRTSVNFCRWPALRR